MKNFIKKLANFDGTIYLKRAIAQIDLESAKLKMEKGALMLASPELKEMQLAGESALSSSNPENFDLLISNRIARDGEECHITILNSKDISEIIKSRLEEKKAANPASTRKELEESIKTDILKESNEQFSPSFNSLGLGRAEKDGSVCYYVIVNFPSGNDIRAIFGKGEKDFHITVGFDPKDIHDVGKGEDTKIMDI